MIEEQKKDFIVQQLRLNLPSTTSRLT